MASNLVVTGVTSHYFTDGVATAGGEPSFKFCKMSEHFLSIYHILTLGEETFVSVFSTWDALNP